MNSECLLIDDRDETDEPGAFLELGTNRLARDLFLLTAVYALFVVMFLAASFRLAADRSWSREAHLDERAEAPGGMLFAVHLRQDGRIQVGEHLVAGPQAVTDAVRQLLGQQPELRDARVILNTYSGTPSVRTSDTTQALAAAGLDPKRFYLRFTEN
jgi:hypothetical protein